jgi:hypothetical protein
VVPIVIAADVKKSEFATAVWLVWAFPASRTAKPNGRPFPNTTACHLAYWHLNANQLSSGGDAKSHQTAERDEQLKHQEAAALSATKIANLHHTNECRHCVPWDDKNCAT